MALGAAIETPCTLPIPTPSALSSLPGALPPVAQYTDRPPACTRPCALPLLRAALLAVRRRWLALGLRLRRFPSFVCLLAPGMTSLCVVVTSLFLHSPLLLHRPWSSVTAPHLLWPTIPLPALALICLALPHLDLTSSQPTSHTLSFAFLVPVLRPPARSEQTLLLPATAATRRRRPRTPI